eukprot:c10064_g1_i1 orf=500-2077(-)
MTNFGVTRAGGSSGLEWQCVSAFSTSFRGGFIWKGEGFVSSKGRLWCSRRGGCNIASSFAAQPQVDSKPPLSCQSIKKKIAMWVGYVGTHYKGLQIQRSTAAGQTIEQELETAIFRAGGILESNFGSLEKIRWMRSSRTDKGVHSLSTVISFKMEVNQETWGNDEDGIDVADRINQFLPNTIRIFGIVPVNKSFDPRRGCCSRTYYYLLPAATLGITQNTCTEEVQQCLVKFQNILSSLEGRHPYHNYTVRSQYRKRSAVSREKSPTKHDATKEEENLLLSEEFSSDEDQIDNNATTSNPECFLAANEISLPAPKVRWLYELDMADKIFSAHFRKVFSFTCGGLQTYEGLTFLKLTVHGESFMLHQIRKMVGTAIAIMREVLPADIIPVSLSRPCRVVLPLAPSEGLLLACNEFYPFRTSSFRPKGSQKLDDLPRLKMSAKVLEKKEEFWQNVLLPHMIILLQESNAVWSDWLELLEGGRLPKAEMDNVREAWREWRLQASKSRALKGLESQDTTAHIEDCMVLT